MATSSLITRQVLTLKPAERKSQARSSSAGKLLAELPGKPTTEELLVAWRRLDDKPLVELVSAPEHLCFNVARSWDGKRTLVYLLNYGPQPVASCQAKLNLPTMSRSLRLHAPGGEAHSLAAAAESEGQSVRIPAFDLFAVLEVR